MKLLSTFLLIISFFQFSFAHASPNPAGPAVAPESSKAEDCAKLLISYAELHDADFHSLADLDVHLRNRTSATLLLKVSTADLNLSFLALQNITNNTQLATGLNLGGITDNHLFLVLNGTASEIRTGLSNLASILGKTDLLPLATFSVLGVQDKKVTFKLQAPERMATFRPDSFESNEELEGKFEAELEKHPRLAVFLINKTSSQFAFILPNRELRGITPKILARLGIKFVKMNEARLSHTLLRESERLQNSVILFFKDNVVISAKAFRALNSLNGEQLPLNTREVARLSAALRNLVNECTQPACFTETPQLVEEDPALMTEVPTIVDPTADFAENVAAPSFSMEASVLLTSPYVPTRLAFSTSSALSLPTPSIVTPREPTPIEEAPLVLEAPDADEDDQNYVPRQTVYLAPESELPKLNLEDLVPLHVYKISLSSSISQEKFNSFFASQSYFESELKRMAHFALPRGNGEFSVPIDCPTKGATEVYFQKIENSQRGTELRVVALRGLRSNSEYGVSEENLAWRELADHYSIPNVLIELNSPGSRPFLINSVFPNRVFVSAGTIAKIIIKHSTAFSDIIDVMKNAEHAGGLPERHTFRSITPRNGRIYTIYFYVESSPNGVLVGIRTMIVENRNRQRNASSFGQTSPVHFN